jgi:hypothetical protein
MIDEHITYLQALLGKFRGRRESFENELFRLEERKKRKELDKEKFQRESGGFLRFGKKRYAKERLNEVERELRVINEETLALNEKIGDVDKVIDLYLNLQKKLEVTSDYRKKLNSILDRSKEYQRLLSEIIKPKRFYERTTELTQDEQIKIIHKIVTEQEEALSREGILTEILDLEHFKDYMRSVIRVYRTPNIMGLKSSYRSDYIWVTVQTPQGLWDSELTQELYTALAAYVTGDVSKTITVREVRARDPWVIRIVVVGGRGRMEDLDSYDEMERLNRKASEFEVSLSRSFLIEHDPSLKSILEKIGAK